MSELRVKLDPKIKEKAQKIFEKMGMGLNDAVKIFISQSINSKSLPFRPHLQQDNKSQLFPNKETIAAFAEVENGNYSKSSLSDFKKQIKSLKTD